ncbi:MAG: hypothetical protein IPG72_10805 [Ardenticatenales bacterium]|nr:hypothetical protein [Ardenticatenales bacterium]
MNATLARRTARGTTFGLAAVGLLAAAFGASRGSVVRAAPPMPTERIQADNACYVKLPSLPQARYGGFGGYNEKTGVMTFAGGGIALTADNSVSDHDLYAVKLDGAMASWNTVMYGGDEGYTRENNKGCREMATAKVADGVWASVLGTGGCDNGHVDAATKSGGDVRLLSIGSSPDAKGVRWLPDSLNVGSVPADVAAQAGRLTHLWAVVDSQRGRAVFGQGTFNTLSEAASQDGVWTAAPSGTKWNVREMRTGGTMPARRYGACAAYVYDKDLGLDGVFVVGGTPGGGRAAFKQALWLDLKSGGTWSDVSARFSNLDAFGARADGACAYNGTTHQFYSWMGTADPKIADGAAYSGGVWRTNLAPLGQTEGQLTWERLAKDNLPGITGRSMVPGVFDWAQNRLFVMGGLNGTAEQSDVWAIYPDVTGDACQTIDPYAPFRVAPTPTQPPVATPVPGAQPEPQVCPSVEGKVPAAIMSAAVANPAGIYGWGVRCSPNLPASPTNGMRRWLTLRSPSLPFHPMFNSIVWSCGCR